MELEAVAEKAAAVPEAEVKPENVGKKARSRNSQPNVSCNICAPSTNGAANMFSNADGLGNHTRLTSGDTMMSGNHVDEHAWQFCAGKPHCVTVTLKLTRLDSETPNALITDAVHSLLTASQKKPPAFVNLAYALMDTAIMGLTPKGKIMQEVQKYFGALSHKSKEVPPGQLLNKHDSRYKPARYCDASRIDDSTMSMRLHIKSIYIAKILEEVLCFLILVLQRLTL